MKKTMQHLFGKRYFGLLLLAFLIAMIFFLSSCVSLKKYNEDTEQLKTNQKLLQKENSELKTINRRFQEMIDECEAERLHFKNKNK